MRDLSRTKGSKYSIGALLRDCRSDSVHLSADGAMLILPFRNVANLDRMKEELDSPGARVRDTIENAIEQTFGTRYAFEVTLANGNSNASFGGNAGANASSGDNGGGGGGRPTRSSVQDSPLVRTAMGMGGRIINDSVDDPQETPN